MSGSDRQRTLSPWPGASDTPRLPGVPARLVDLAGGEWPLTGKGVRGELM